MSFRLKVILGVATIEVLLLSLLVFSSMRYLSGSNKEQLYDRARTSVQLFSTMAAEATLAMDLAALDALAAKTASNPGIAYARVRNPSGSVLSEKGDAASLQRPFHADVNIDDVGSDQTFDVAQDILVNGKSFGRVELGLSIKAFEKLLEEAARYMLGVALIEVVLVGVFGFILGRVLTTQLIALQLGARKVADGELGYTIQVRGNDELADTAKSFNAMSCALHDYARDLKKARDKAERGRMRAESLLQKAVESLPQGIVITDKSDRIIHLNQAFTEIYEIGPNELLHMKTCADVRRILRAGSDDVYVGEPQCTPEDIPTTKLANGRYILRGYQTLSIGGAVWVVTDITRLIEAEERTRKLERELLQSQKMESIGTLAGGIAHEINTPIQYIGDNLRFMGGSVGDLLTLLTGYEALAKEGNSGKISSALLEQCQARVEDIDLDFLRDELPKAVEQSIHGVEQVSKIVLALKEFAHPSSKEKDLVDINRIVERSLVICKNKWKTVAEVKLHLAEGISPFPAYENDLNQVVLNLIVNAAQAIEEHASDKGQIDVTTQSLPDGVVLSVRDNGCGIPDGIRERIFDPFFTTKDVGKGSGQGLAICYDIIVNKHGGRIDVQSVPGEGTAFQVVLPVSEW